MMSSAGQGPYGPRRRLSLNGWNLQEVASHLVGGQVLPEPVVCQISRIPDGERHPEQTRWHGFDKDVRGWGLSYYHQ